MPSEARVPLPAPGRRTLRFPFTLLGPFSDYRVRLAATRWLWEHGRLAGLKLQLVTERARAEYVDGQPPHELVFPAKQPQ